jgi:hypothetical protein
MFYGGADSRRRHRTCAAARGALVGTGRVWLAGQRRADLNRLQPNAAKPRGDRAALNPVLRDLRSIPGTVAPPRPAAVPAVPPRTPNGGPFFERFGTRRLTIGSGELKVRSTA